MDVNRKTTSFGTSATELPMISLHSRPLLRSARLVAWAVLLACPGVRAEESGAGDAGLVRVTIFKSFTDTRGAGQTVELNGRTIPN